MINTISTISIGVDVSKKYLDAHCHQDQKFIRVTNDSTGINKLVKWSLVKGNSPLIVIEPSGGYEYLLERKVSENRDFRVAKVNAKYIRDFARAKGRLAKTDQIDAQTIAEYGAIMSPRNNIDISAQQLELKALVIRRRQVVKTLSEENNRLEKVKFDLARKSIEQLILFLKAEIKSLDKMISDIIKSSEALVAAYKLLQEMCGIGSITASSLLADLPELGRIGNKEISSLVGVAPHNVDSGTMRGQRVIQGGRTEIRKVLYLATLTATRYDGVIRDFYLSLVARGKKPKVAIIACIRKMIVILNAKMRDHYALSA